MPDGSSETEISVVKSLVFVKETTCPVRLTIEISVSLERFSSVKKSVAGFG
jgi:hypothetical protein